MEINKLKIKILSILLLFVIASSTYADGTIRWPYIIPSLDVLYVSNPNGAKLYKEIGDDNSIVKEDVLPMGGACEVYAKMNDENRNIWYLVRINEIYDYGSIEKFSNGYKVNYKLKNTYEREQFYIRGSDLINSEEFEANRDYYINALIKNKVIIGNEERDVNVSNKINELYEKINCDSLLKSIKLVLMIFLFTVIIEIFIALILGIRGKKNLLVILLANALTNIPLNIFLLNVYRQNNNSTPLIILFAEIVVAAIESVIYYYFINFDKSILNRIKNKLISPIALSLISNIASYMIVSLLKY